jgi:hypothetical protein
MPVIRFHPFIFTRLADITFTLVHSQDDLSLISPYLPFSLPYLDTYSFTDP